MWQVLHTGLELNRNSVVTEYSLSLASVYGVGNHPTTMRTTFGTRLPV